MVSSQDDTVTSDMHIRTPYLLFLGDARDALAAKTGQGIVDWRPDAVAGQMRLPGCGADLGVAELSISDAVRAGARTLVIGAVNPGGVLPDTWRVHIVEALEAGLDIASGMHVRLVDIPEVAETAARIGRRLFDVRHPSGSFHTASGRKRTGKRLLTVGTDCSVGKKYTALAIERELLRRGVDADYRATGQTGILISGSGIAIDAVVSDFAAGAAETLSPDADADHWDVVEGQGSLVPSVFRRCQPGVAARYPAGRFRRLPRADPQDHAQCENTHCVHRRRDRRDRRARAPDESPYPVCRVSRWIHRRFPSPMRLRVIEETAHRFELPACDPVRQGVGAIVDGLP